MRALGWSPMQVIFVCLLAVISLAGRSEAWGAGASSGVLFSANAFLYNQSSNNNGSTSEDNRSIYDIKLGYLTGGSLYLGGIYTSRSHSGSGFISESGSATGVSIGYMGDAGFFLMGHYYLSATNGDYSDGSGYQGDFGYMVNVTGSFHVGVELTYRNLEYKKVNGNPTSLTAKELFPMLTAAFIF